MTNKSKETAGKNIGKPFPLLRHKNYSILQPSEITMYHYYYNHLRYYIKGIKH